MNIDEAVDLLRFALDAAGVEPSKLQIVRVGEELRRQDGYALAEGRNGTWAVIYIERGKDRVEAKFARYREAFKFVFLQLQDDPGPWRHREEWEESKPLQQGS